jgi:redox-sensitive bicupin YhaK (pirin superfamily)
MSLSNFDPTPLAPAPARATPRPIVHRTRGATHGPITRLVSPSDVGALIKPFVFLDFFSAEPRGFGGFGWHPHSGITTVSVILKGAVTYEETTGANGVLPAGAVEWMRAGKGVWHTGGPSGTDRIEGYQLWVALPSDLESGPSASRYVQPGEVAADGPYRVILGRYGNAKSVIAAPPAMNYLVVDLKAGERWSYAPPPGHTVGWIAVHAGKVLAPAPVTRGELAVFARSSDPIDLVAEGDTSFVLGSAVPHPHELVLGSYSVHTSREALADGEAEIRRIRDTSAVLRPLLQRGGR